MEWCDDNCVAEWDIIEIRETAGDTDGVYMFTFIADRDAVLFSLRWQ